jgi:type II secretory pathway predicted ATPase ExeA
MYEAYWNLTSKPFAYRVESADLYRTRTLQSAALRLRYCFDNNAGAALLLGASGMGKSSLLQCLRSESSELYPFVHVAYATLTPAELSRTVAAEILGDQSIDDLPGDALLSTLHRALRKHADAGQHTVIAFDEAHLLSNNSLNEVVLPLLNLADTDHDLSLSVILSGQPVLASHVARNAQLRERIAVRATLDPFTENEIRHYIQSRLEAAGAKKPLFSDGAIQAITELSEGNPRRINKLCDMSLLVGYGEQISQITEAEVLSLSVEILPAAA